MKQIFTILLLCFSTALVAQPCLPEGIIFSSQMEVDSFDVNYPYCSEIEGSVVIQGLDIHSLLGLHDIESIGGDLVIGGTNDTAGTSLTDLYGLYYLTSIESNLIIENNPILTSLLGMNSLSPGLIDSMSIQNNPMLSLCDVPSICNYISTPNAAILISNNEPGCNDEYEIMFECENNCLPGGINFETQASIDNFQENYPGCNDILGYVTIEGDDISSLLGLNIVKTIRGRLLIGAYNPDYYNILLFNLNGLENLTYIGGILAIYWNDELINCNGLNNLTHVGGYFKVWGNHQLEDLSGLENLTYVGHSVEFRNNYELTHLSGLENLKHIENDLNILFNDELINLTGLESITHIGGRLIVNENPELISLNGLNNNDPISIKEDIIIVDNELLSNIFGLENISMGSVDGLKIYENFSLSTCEAQNICDYLADTNSIVVIHSNASGCNSPEEVIEGCHSCLPDGITFSTQEQVDSFPLNHPECIHIRGNVSIIGYNEISNLDSLGVLTSIGGALLIKDNYSLLNLTGLNNLTSVGGDFGIEGNELLKSLEALVNLNSIGEFLWINNNESLESLNGLENINPNPIEYLQISNNPALSYCEVVSICEYLLLPYNQADIFDNAPGCNSEDEVYDACWVNISDTKDNTAYFSIYPTPTNKLLNIKAYNIISKYDIEIRNIYGQMIREEKDIQSIDYTINVSDLKAGVYFYAIKEKGEIVQQGKIVKK